MKKLFVLLLGLITANVFAECVYVQPGLATQNELVSAIVDCNSSCFNRDLYDVERSKACNYKSLMIARNGYMTDLGSLHPFEDAINAGLLACYFDNSNLNGYCNVMIRQFLDAERDSCVYSTENNEKTDRCHLSRVALFNLVNDKCDNLYDGSNETYTKAAIAECKKSNNYKVSYNKYVRSCNKLKTEFHIHDEIMGLVNYWCGKTASSPLSNSSGGQGRGLDLSDDSPI